ncbi:MAG: MATE family efflux transporter [Fusobacterium sp.]|uniref:MATE family efflux transporter n=1 Tax=Fusobacterium sp. TaxID=68766 RepID=UPI0026DBDE02|nr:MATE family efflux transporter [Fusobacterium sp.]MDO4690188.1 MATE family efflux transporter [Fusobacterium sp.]
MFNLDYMKDKEVIKEVLRISIPAVLDVLAQTLLGAFDMMMVGSLGSAAISSVGIGSAPFNAILPAIMSVGIGAAALISRAFGAQNKEEAKRATIQSLIISVPLGIFITLIFTIFSREVISLVARDESFDLRNAIIYHNINALGFIFIAFNAVFFSAFRAISRTKIPMIGNIICLFINVILNYFFIFVLKMGVAGAAIATTLARSSLTIISFYLVFYKKSEWIKLGKVDLFIDLQVIKRVVKVAIPAAIEQLSLRIGMLIFEIMVISLGSLSYSSHKIASTAEAFSFSLGFAFSFAATALVGQELGRENPQKAMRNGYICMTMGLIVMSAMGLIFFIAPKLIISLFTKEVDVRIVASSVLKIVSICQPFLAVTMVLSGALRGAGATKSVLLVTFLGIFLVRIPTTYFFLNILKTGLIGAWIVMTIDLAFRSIIIFYIFKKGSWQYIKV